MPRPFTFFDTLKRRKVDFQPQDPSNVLIYTCGPTVYDFAHIGNFRTFVVEDLLRRTLKFLGYQPYQVMNITDVDDKTINGAIQSGTSLAEFTSRYTKAFMEDLKLLRIEPAEHYPKATDYIPAMISMIQRLVDCGSAYVGSDKSVYFKIASCSSYGCLSHLHLDQLQEGASERKPHGDYTKDQAADFVLWKAYDPERDKHVFWESPWGKGRPGWHIECSAMASELLGPTIDIHAGGVDLIFPHHENEIAQSESASKKPFCNNWFHVEHLLVDGKKMSKSLNNFLTLRALVEQEYSGVVVRYLLLSAHYRHQLNFTYSALEGAKQAVQRVNDFWTRLQRTEPSPQKEQSEVETVPINTIQAFTRALQDDLNISEALAHLFEFIRMMNNAIDMKQLTSPLLDQAKSTFLRMNSVLDLIIQPDNVIPEAIQKLLEERNKARKAKQFQVADKLRHDLLSLGYTIEDTPQGSLVRKKLI